MEERRLGCRREDQDGGEKIRIEERRLG